MLNYEWWKGLTYSLDRWLVERTVLLSLIKFDFSVGICSSIRQCSVFFHSPRFRRAVGRCCPKSFLAMNRLNVAACADGFSAWQIVRVSVWCGVFNGFIVIVNPPATTNNDAVVGHKWTFSVLIFILRFSSYMYVCMCFDCLLVSIDWATLTL